jgi:hypothetical protein
MREQGGRWWVESTLLVEGTGVANGKTLVRLPTPYRAPMRSVLAALLVLRQRYGDLAALGDDIWRLIAPDQEPAFFQSPTSPNASLEPLAVGDVGLAIVGVGHTYKGADTTTDPEPWGGAPSHFGGSCAPSCP